jgi:hypothetical protein
MLEAKMERTNKKMKGYALFDEATSMVLESSSVTPL